MSLFKKREAASGADLSAFTPVLTGNQVSPTRALQVGALWACIRLRADLISTFPVDEFRKIKGRSVEVEKSQFFKRPSHLLRWNEWMWATSYDLDLNGNALGFIAARNGAGNPTQIEPTDATDWVVRYVKGKAKYRYKGHKVDSDDVWHERQYPAGGSPVGLSPLALASKTLAHNVSASDFARAWFNSGAAPSGVFKNVDRTITSTEADAVKMRFKKATEDRSVMVTGKDWEYDLAAASGSDAKFLESIDATSTDICRFLSVPADMIDAATGASTITYANIHQRNLQLLTMNLGPAIARREAALADLAISDRTVKLNTAAMLRMDEKSKIETIGAGIDKRIITPNEGRELLDRPPLTPADYAEFDKLWPSKQAPTQTQGVN